MNYATLVVTDENMQANRRELLEKGKGKRLVRLRQHLCSLAWYFLSLTHAARLVVLNTSDRLSSSKRRVGDA